MATCTIRSVFSTSQNVKVDDYVPEAGNSTNSKFVAILNEGQTFNPEPQYIKTLKAQNISFLEKNTGDLNNFNTIFPNGYTIMSTEMKYSKWISYRLTNRYSYSYKLNTTMLLLLSQTLSTLPFELTCQICNSDDTLFETVTLPSLSVGTAYIYATINATIPAGKYIQFRMRCPPPPSGETASSPMPFQTLLNYLVISHTGTKVAVPEMTYDVTSITSTYEEVDAKPIKLYLKPSLKGDDLAGHKVQFYANLNSQRTNLGEETIGAINAGVYSVTRQLPKEKLPVGAYTISVELKRPATSPTNYVQNASTTVNALAYTVNKQKIVLTTTIDSPKVSYLGNFIINSSIDYKKLGTVSVKITSGSDYVRNDFMTFLPANGDYFYTKPVKTPPMDMTIGTTYTVETQFIPDSSVASNFEASDVKTVTFTIDSYKMVISVINNLTTIKYRESIEFDAIPKTGNDSAESQVTGDKSIVISKNGVEVETHSVPYTLTPYQTSLYSPGTYVAVAKFSNASAGAVVDSDAYTFTIEAQNTTLAVNTEPWRIIYGDANTSDDDIKTVEGVFTYAYNTPFTVSGVLKTGTVSQLAKIQSGTPAQTIPIVIKDANNATVFDGEYTIDESGAVTSFKSGHGPSGTELLLAIDPANASVYYYDATNTTVNGLITNSGIALSSFPGMDTYLSVTNAPLWNFYISDGVYVAANKVAGETTTTVEAGYSTFKNDDSDFSIFVDEALSTFSIKDNNDNVLITLAYTKNGDDLTSLKEGGNDTELLIPNLSEIESALYNGNIFNYTNKLIIQTTTTGNNTLFAFSSTSTVLASYFKNNGSNYSYNNTYFIRQTNNHGLRLFTFYDETITTTTDSSFVDHNFSTRGLTVTTQIVGGSNGDITNFQLTRDTDSVDVSSRISNVTMVNGQDADGPTVVYTLKVSSPADIGAGLDTDTPVDFTLKWNPPNANYLLSTAPIKVKALKDFVELKIEAAQTSVKFEDNIVITCTVSNQEQDMTVPHPDLNGTYKLYRKKLLDATWPTEPILTQVDDSNTKTSVFTVPALELEIGTHMFYVDYVPSNPLSANFYPEIRAPANISIDVQKIDTNFAVKMIDIIEDEITSVNVDQKVRFRVTDCKTQFGDGHAVEGTLSLISPVVTGFSTVTFSDNGVTNGDFNDFKIMELLIPKTTTSFVFKFTPTRSSHFNAKEITLNTAINSAGALPFIGSGTDLANGSPTYLEDIVINLQLTLVSSERGIGNNIPLSGKLELIKTDNSVESVIYNNNNENVTITENSFVINTGKKPYDFGFTYNIPVSLTLRFTPTNDEYKYYSKYEKTVTIVSQKQTLQKINIITTKSTYTYGEKIGLSVNTGDSYPFTGKIKYYLQKVVNGSGVGDMSHIGDSDIVNASSTAVKEFVITHLEAGDANNASTPYQITCHFISDVTEVNFMSSTADNISTEIEAGKTQVVPQPIAHAKSTVKLTNLKFNYKNKKNEDVPETNLETIYNNNIELLNSSTLTITGDISNSVSTDTRLVGNGTVSVINRYTQEDGAVSTTVYKSAPVSNGTFTISYAPTITGEILLIYESTQNFLSNTNNLSQSDDFNTYYLILSNIPYDIEMSIGATVGVGITDYHDGSFTANVNMKNFLRSEDAKDVSDNQDKFLLTISNTNGDIVYSTKLDLVEEKTNTVGSFTFIPRKLSSTVPRPATTSLTNGLETGDYLLKVSYEGIAGFYDAEQANDSLIPANKFIRFTVAKTNPAIKSALTHRFNGNDNTLMAETKLDDDAAGYAMVQTTDDTASFFYRELPNMSIRVQTHRTTFATYNADNDLSGKTVVKFHHTSFPDLSTKDYKIVNITGAAGASGVSNNEITNIVDTKIVQLPLLDAGSVTYIELEFTPDDTRNYNSKNVLIRTEVKKYTPVLLNAPNTDDYKIKVVPNNDGGRSSNVLQSLAYDTNGVINYDENFEVHNKLQQKDPLTDIPYDNIDGELKFRYYSTDPTNPTPINDAAIPVIIDNNKRDYKTTFNPKDILSEAERVNVGNHTMIVSFEPSDLANYNESEPISRDFSIYIANDVGIVDIKDPVPTVVFNKQQTLTLTATVTFGPNVDPKTGNLSFYWGNGTDTYPVFDAEHLLSTSKNDTSTGALEVGGLSADYSLAINTTDSNNVMLTPRYDPYFIYAKLTPTSNNYPVIIHSVKKTVQINPSLVITISSTGGKTSVSGPNTLSYIEVGDANDDIILKATLVHHNEAYSGGVANFIITKGSDTYVAGVPFTNNVAEFHTKTVDSAQNIKQNGAPVSQFTMGFGEYVVRCHAEFGDNRYKEIDEDYFNGYLIKKRTSTYSLSIDKTNIVYGNIRPKVTTKFDEDFVYGGYFTYTIIYTSVNGVTTIEQVQNLTNDADKFGSNPPSQTYTLELSSLVDSFNNIIDLTVGSYSITSTYSSPPNFSGSSSNTVYFVVNKKDVVINPLVNFYSSSNTSHEFTLSATLTNPDITDSSVKFVNTTTNQVYSATHSGGNYSVTVSGNDLLAGTYEIMAYFSGNFNYNKSNNVFSNLIVQRQQKPITLTLVSPTVNASNEYTLDVNTVTGDTVHVYSTHKKEAIAVLSHTADHIYKIADTLLNVGLNRVFVTVVHPNYSGNSNIVEITRPKMPLTVSSFASSASTVPYKGTVTLTANVTTGRGYTVTEGETMDFYVNDSHAGTVDVANNIATLPNVCLREMGANVIVAKFVNSKSYVCENTHSSITVTVTKADMDVTLYDETSSDMNKLNNKTVSLYLGTLTPTNKTNTTDDVVEFSRINSGTATFYNNNDIIYDNVPVINGIASISLSMDLASYSIKARFNGNVNYNSSDFSSILTFTTTQKAISDYYASVILAEGSKNDGKTCYIIANVALKSGVASMPASSLLLNTGVVTFTFQHVKEIVNPDNSEVTYENETVTKIVNLVDGVATANFKSSSKDTLPTVVYSNTAYSGTLSPSSNAWPVDYLALDFLNSASRQYVNIFKTSQTTFDINKPFRFTQRCILTILVRAGTYIRYIDTSPQNTPIVTTTSIKNDDEYVTININIETGSFYVIFSPNTTSINMSYTSPFQYQGTWTFSSEVSLSISNGTIQNRSFSYYGLNGIRNDNETGIVSYTLS
jgi:hypothetical protein